MISKEKLIHWNYQKNTKQPESFSNGSSFNAHWICEKGHEWSICIKNKKGCPYCANKLVGYGNDLLSVYPEAVKEWHPTKNIPLLPSQVTFKATTQVWWQCQHGHEWKADVRRFHKGYQCPYCTTKKTAPEQSIASHKPDFLNEFNTFKNHLDPLTLSLGSTKKVWWICKKGHEWQSSVRNRTQGSHCPRCKLCGTSRPELFLFDELSKLFPSAIHRHKTTFGELDIFIPEINIAIEYDGWRWHKERIEKDIQKFNSAKNNKIIIINIREYLLPIFNEFNIQTKYPKSKILQQQLLDSVLNKIEYIKNTINFD